MLYRAATNFTNRDMFLLSSADHGEHFRGQRLHPWKLETCPMSSTVMAETKDGVLAAWETAGHVYFARVPSSTGVEPIAAPGDGKGRKHPAIAVNRAGDVLLVWTEGMGWKRGGNLAWQVFDANGRPKGQSGAADGVPVWSLPTAIVLPDGGFEIVY